MVNNYDGLAASASLYFLRDIGKYFTVNYMMSKESVKKRIETGISYTEFSLPNHAKVTTSSFLTKTTT